MPGANTGRVAAHDHPASKQATAPAPAEPEALCVTNWFDSGKGGEPYGATVRFSGRRVGIRGRPQSQDGFVQEQTIDRIVPGSGPVSITTWVSGLGPGEWTVTAELIRLPNGAPGHPRLVGAKFAGSHTLPRAAWSWKQWKLASGPFTPVKTRWAPFVRLARMPAVIPGSWPGLVALGVLVGFGVQAAILGQESVSVGRSLVVDVLGLLSGLTGAKVWYLAQQPRFWRQSMAEGWSVDGFLLATPAVGAAALLAFSLPIGVFLDASAPALFFGVAIGRLGCFFTGCCAGRCTRSRWGVWSSDRRVGARRIPTQLLESAAGLLIAVGSTLLVLRYAPALHGSTFVAAAATYLLVRQFLLRLRAEPHKSSIRASLTATAAAVVLVLDGVLLLMQAT